MAWITDDSANRLLVRYSGHGFNNRLFNDRTCLDNSNTRLVRNSDPAVQLWSKNRYSRDPRTRHVKILNGQNVAWCGKVQFLWWHKILHKKPQPFKNQTKKSSFECKKQDGRNFFCLLMFILWSFPWLLLSWTFLTHFLTYDGLFDRPTDDLHPNSMLHIFTRL